MKIDWSKTKAAIYRAKRDMLKPIRDKDIDDISLEELIGIDRQKKVLQNNTRYFMQGKSANNALLWGARGTGKSSLVKAVFNRYKDEGLRLIEIRKDDLDNLLDIIDEIRESSYKFVLFCDDLSFSEDDVSYRSLKSALEGSIEKTPSNVIIYATSNRRHLLPEFQKENNDICLDNGELHYGDSIEEKISLSDRFGLWLSFYQPSQDDYLCIVESYFSDFGIDKETLYKEAIKFANQKGGSRSGRCAKQFFNYYSNMI